MWDNPFLVMSMSLEEVRGRLEEGGREKVTVGRPRNTVSGENGEWELSRLRARHHMMISLHCAGLSNYEIAQQIGCTPQTVSNTLNSEIGREEVRKALEKLQDGRADALGILNDNVNAVANNLVRLALTSEKEDVQARVGLGILDRTGTGPMRTNVNVDRKFSKEDLEDVMRRAKEGGMEIREQVEDAEFEDISGEVIVINNQEEGND